jgi:transposase
MHTHQRIRSRRHHRPRHRQEHLPPRRSRQAGRNRDVSRNQLLRRLVNLPACLLGLEARPGSGSHHIARQIQPLGHDVRLIPAQYVKPFLKGHKNDFRDAEAFAEAVQRPTMRFVAIKTPERAIYSRSTASARA